LVLINKKIYINKINKHFNFKNSVNTITDVKINNYLEIKISEEYYQFISMHKARVTNSALYSPGYKISSIILELLTSKEKHKIMLGLNLL
jgi:uncharacterized HAD superfamily protein